MKALRQGSDLRDMLAFAGRNGPLMLFAGVLVGLAAPPLAEAARPLLGAAVFVFTLGAFLKVDRASFRTEFSGHGAWKAATAMLAWTTFGVPLAMLGLLHLCQPDPASAQAMMLCMLAPPVGSAAAIAAMLGLNAPLALFATVAATVLSPVFLPPLASWFAGYHSLRIDPVAMTVRLLVIVGGACLAATLLRRCAGRFVAENPHAMTGVAVLGLIFVAVGAMRGMQGTFLAHPAEVASILCLAFAVNVGFQALGAALFAPWGRSRALTVGLVSGNRNVTLAWAAAGTAIAGQPQVELYFAMSVFPIFMLPALMRCMLEWLWPSGPAQTAPEMSEPSATARSVQ